MLLAPHNKCALSQKCRALQPFDTSHIAQTAEDRYAHAYGADSASLAAHTPAAASANDAAAVSSVMLSGTLLQGDAPTTFTRLKKENNAGAYYVRVVFT